MYLIADTHFGHKNIITYENRPFANVEHMDAELIRNWNNVISKRDKIFILGDFSFHSKEKTQEIVSELNGHKILVMGNHDMGRNIKWWYEVGFNEVYKYPILVNEFLQLSHEPPQYMPPNTPYFYLYGHVHSSEMYKTITKTSACVSLERWNYTPVKFDEIERLVKLCH